MARFIDPATQEANLIREIGDKLQELGGPIENYKIEDVGTELLMKKLKAADIIDFLKPVPSYGPTICTYLSLTLTTSGWKRYRAITQ